MWIELFVIAESLDPQLCVTISCGLNYRRTLQKTQFFTAANFNYPDPSCIMYDEIEPGVRKKSDTIDVLLLDWKMRAHRPFDISISTPAKGNSKAIML